MRTMRTMRTSIFFTRPPLGARTSSFAPLLSARSALASAARAAAPFTPDSPLKFAGAAATALAAVYFYTHESEEAVIEGMCSTFERGGMPAWDRMFLGDLAPGRVPRSALQAELLALLSPLGEPDAFRFAAVVGASGTGKSTAVRKAVRAAGSPGAKGAVYFLAPTGITSFSTDLMRALGYREPFSLLSPFRHLVFKDAKETFGPQSALPQPVASWRALAPLLQRAAERFALRHGRPAVLVLDAMDLVAKKDAIFFLEVQDFAKDCADKGILRIVLVLSDGRALALLQSSSALTRATEPCEVGDIGDGEAVAYLEGLGVATERAKALVEEVAGGRFPLLQAHGKSARPIEDIVQQLHNGTKEALKAVHVAPIDPLLKLLLEQGSVRSGDALDLLAEDKVTALLGRNILAAHPDGTYTFHSRHVASFVAAREAAARAA